IFLFTMSNSAVSSFPRRVAAPGFVPSFPSPACTGGGFETRPYARGMERREAQLKSALARRGRVPPDALASRRSTVAILGPGVRASVSGIVLRSACSEASRSRVVVPGGRTPCLPSRRLQAAAAGRHTSLRQRDCLRKTPLDEQGWARRYTICDLGQEKK